MSEEKKPVEIKVEMDKEINQLYQKYFQTVGSMQPESAAVLTIAHVLKQSLAELKAIKIELQTINFNQR